MILFISHSPTLELDAPLDDAVLVEAVPEVVGVIDTEGIVLVAVTTVVVATDSVTSIPSVKDRSASALSPTVLYASPCGSSMMSVSQLVSILVLGFRYLTVGFVVPPVRGTDPV